MFNISVIVNTFAIIIGGSLGLLIGNKLKDNYRNILFQAIGLTTIAIGMKMAFKANDLLVVLGSLALGGLLGEFWNIEGGIGKIANKLENSKGETPFVKGFITATVLFVVGPMTILGCMSAGTGDNSLIFLKSLLDGISSIVLASVYGTGVIFSALSVYIVQGLLVVFAGSLNFLSNPTYLNDFTAVGGLMVFAIALRLLNIKEIKVGNFLPSLIFVILIDFIKTLF
ncbi:membrane protein [Tepiditoga spiralis]|uniref:Membrane protein n=1 Tax=Tepiditoga spiralis TaxID=2108365 RepID=A0A7G1GAD5_9BACT|nr:DUF554 domain-containing protein [Tepiditoga spiralis]BBE30409.1 membrane protein [Tepiditoga spiralis]